MFADAHFAGLDGRKTSAGSAMGSLRHTGCDTRVTNVVSAKLGWSGVASARLVNARDTPSGFLTECIRRDHREDRGAGKSDRLRFLHRRQRAWRCVIAKLLHLNNAECGPSRPEPAPPV